VTGKETHHKPNSLETTHASQRRTIPSSEVGVTLTISEEALRQIDRIQEKSIRAAQESLKFSWR